MPEVVKRPSRPNTFAQVAVAVVSGMAAMYCVQSFTGMAAIEKAMVPKDLPGLEGAPAPALVERPPVYEPAPREEPAPQPVVQNSMLLAPEPGYAVEDAGILGAAGDDPEAPKAPAPKKPKAAPAPRAEAPAAKPVPKVALKDARFSGRHFTQSFGAGFDRPTLSPKVYEKPAPPPEAPEPEEEPEAPAPKPAAKTRVKLLSRKVLPAEKVPAAPQFDLEAAQRRPFWTPERRFKVGASGLIAIAGAAYVAYASGLLSALGGRRPEEE